MVMLEKRCGATGGRWLDCFRTGLLKSYADDQDELSFSDVIQRTIMSATGGVHTLELGLNGALKLAAGQDRPTTKLLKIVSDELKSKVAAVAEPDVKGQLQGRQKAYMECYQVCSS
jgi:hypothetical protein